MTAEQFAYWLQGFHELTEGAVPSEAQWQSIGEHLKQVFTKVTPALNQMPIDWTKQICATQPNPNVVTLC